MVIVASLGTGNDIADLIFVTEDSNVNSPEKVLLISKFLLCLTTGKWLHHLCLREKAFI